VGNKNDLTDEPAKQIKNLGGVTGLPIPFAYKTFCILHM